MANGEAVKVNGILSTWLWRVGAVLAVAWVTGISGTNLWCVKELSKGSRYTAEMHTMYESTVIAALRREVERNTEFRTTVKIPPEKVEMRLDLLDGAVNKVSNQIDSLQGMIVEMKVMIASHEAEGRMKLRGE